MTPALFPARNCIPSLPTKQPEVLDTKIFTGGAVSYGGVNFTYDPRLASAVVAETKSANPLRCDSDKPDNVYPQHARFVFKGAYAAKHDGHLRKYGSLKNEASFFSPPEIAIYPIEGYKQAFSISKGMADSFKGQVESLLKIFAQTPSPVAGEIPVLPWIEPSPAFQIRAKRLAFGNGNGVIFLTHYDIEEDIIHNQGLGYVYQGLTSDGRFYVSGFFPVRARLLPGDQNVREVDGFAPDRTSRPDDEAYRKKYAAYKAAVIEKLETLPAEKYDPSLTSFETLIRSLKIENQR
jgi:hypothetical protein